MRRRLVLAWAIALALTSPLVLFTGELFSLEAVLVSLVAFPSGLFALVRLVVPDAAGSPLARALGGWTILVAVSVLVLTCRQPHTCRRLFLVLCILLGANVVGCYVR